jgi:uncharacterized protein (TIGR03067 family)
LKPALVFAALTGCALLLADRDALAADPDLPAFQGKWTVESFEYNGTPVEIMKEGTREIKEDKYTLTPKSGEAINGVIKLDSSKKPKQIDLEVNGRTLKGIYEIDGDALKLAYTLNGDERPTELVSKPDTGVVLVIHKRAK